MKKLTNEELQFVFGGDGESQNKCDNLQKILNEFEESDDEALNDYYYNLWGELFEKCAYGEG
ncbi:MAG: hypothetical protein K2H32_07595 [Muribaculaceae bacterium]|nr:hypothetical protein [Muribaculaceae bacterium]